MPVIVNWHLAVTVFKEADNPYAALPYQHLAVLRGVACGLTGKPLPAPEEVLADPVRQMSVLFPDLWVASLMRHSFAGLAAGIALLLFSLTIETIIITRLLGGIPP